MRAASFVVLALIVGAVLVFFVSSFGGRTDRDAESSLDRGVPGSLDGQGNGLPLQDTQTTQFPDQKEDIESLNKVESAGSANPTIDRYGVEKSVSLPVDDAARGGGSDATSADSGGPGTSAGTVRPQSGLPPDLESSGSTVGTMLGPEASAAGPDMRAPEADDPQIPMQAPEASDSGLSMLPPEATDAGSMGPGPGESDDRTPTVAPEKQ